MSRSERKSKEKKYMETYRNENTIIHNLWDAAKLDTRWKYTAV